MRVRKIQPVKADKNKKLRVCAYARVSTNTAKQEGTLENQESYFKRMIGANPDYEYAGIFIDQGVSGYRGNRPEFQKMLTKARNGEIDLIVTKSMSRYGRNTIVVLKTIRELRELGVGIFFEEQNINTLSGTVKYFSASFLLWLRKRAGASVKIINGASERSFPGAKL